MNFGAEPGAENSLIAILRRFNRKERNWLVRDALGKGSVGLCETFKARVADEVRKHDPDFAWQEPSWWGTDYHLDWIVAALTCFAAGKVLEPDEVQSNSRGLVTGSQQNIDFLVATGNRLILIEAKGEGGWTGNGFKNKIERLKHLSNALLGIQDLSAESATTFCCARLGKFLA
jgi:hypothetical protein